MPNHYRPDHQVRVHRHDLPARYVMLPGQNLRKTNKADTRGKRDEAPPKRPWCAQRPKFLQKVRTTRRPHNRAYAFPPPRRDRDPAVGSADRNNEGACAVLEH